MTHKINHFKTLGRVVTSKRTPWKPKDLRAVDVFSSGQEEKDLRKADLMRHSHYTKNGTDLIEIRDKQSDPNDITVYQITQQTNGSSDNFYDGSSGNDFLQGAAGDDYLQGREGNDTLIGNGGNDFIDGGTGVDQLTGGEGQDYFRLSLASNAGENVDTITDFNPLQGDKIAIRLTTGQQRALQGRQTVLLSSSNEETIRLLNEGVAVIFESFNGHLVASGSLAGNPNIAVFKLAYFENNPQLLQTDFILAT